jgi:hypothetical protein
MAQLYALAAASLTLGLASCGPVCNAFSVLPPVIIRACIQNDVVGFPDDGADWQVASRVLSHWKVSKLQRPLILGL